LAVATKYARRGLGAALILDAVTRAMRAEPAIFALLVDAKDDPARSFYARLGFRPLASRPSRPYWLIAEAARRLMDNANRPGP
jgi:ribosomal protein S18 acetylase RimI-like enzyme